MEELIQLLNTLTWPAAINLAALILGVAWVLGSRS